MNQPIEPAILALRKRLLSTSRVSFSSQPQPGSLSGWAGRGNGTVVAKAHADNSLTFIESGRFWLEGAAESIAFHNVFRWCPSHAHIGLSHERRGVDAAVWLFDLVAADHEQGCDLISRQAHLCDKDRYQAHLTFMDQGFDLEWTIQGPRKDEHLYYRYR